MGKCLENVAASAEAAEAREALREAVALYREVYEGTEGRMSRDRLRRAETALQELEGRQP